MLRIRMAKFLLAGMASVLAFTIPAQAANCQSQEDPFIDLPCQAKVVQDNAIAGFLLSE
jgi:hypothetical protein